MRHYFVFENNKWRFMAKDAVVSAYFPRFIQVPMQYLWNRGPPNQYVVAVSYYDSPDAFQVGLTGAHIRGEGPNQAAVRELKEELGITTSFRNLDKKYETPRSSGYLVNVKDTIPLEYIPSESSGSDIKRKVGVVVYGTLDELQSRVNMLTGNDGIVKLALLPIGIHH